MSLTCARHAPEDCNLSNETRLASQFFSVCTRNRCNGGARLADKACKMPTTVSRVESAVLLNTQPNKVYLDVESSNETFVPWYNLVKAVCECRSTHSCEEQTALTFAMRRGVWSAKDLVIKKLAQTQFPQCTAMYPRCTPTSRKLNLPDVSNVPE